MTAVVLVPFRPDGGHRDRLWRHLQDTFWSGLPYRVVVGGHEGGRFNRSAAINAAAAVSDWDVAVIADSDTWVPAHQLSEAVRAARDCGRLVSALSGVVELDRRCTDSVLGGRFSPGCLGVERVRVGDLDTQSSMLDFDSGLPSDEHLSAWCGETSYCWPSLVDHADLPTVVCHRDGQPRRPGRTAYRVGVRDVWTESSVPLGA